MPDIGTVSRKVDLMIQNYNNTHEYVAFDANNILQGTNSVSSSMGCMAPLENSVNSSIEMIPFDTNYHTVDSAVYNVTQYYNKLKSDEFDQNQNKTGINGLSTIIVSEYFDDDVTFFTKKILKNEVLSPAELYCDNFTDLSTCTNNFLSINNKTKNVSIEWFGYFIPDKMGYYQFELSSDDSSLLWFDDIALTGYNLTNLTVDNRGLHGRRNIISQPLLLDIRQIYPIRIQYGQRGGGMNLQLKINYKPDLNSKFVFKTNGQGYLKHIGDISSPWEPITLYYALKQPVDSTTHYKVFITKFDRTNNYIFNKKMREARTYPKLKYIPIWTSSNATLTTTNTEYYAYLGKDGNLKLNQNNTPISTISNIDPARFTRCNGDTAITNIIIKIGQNIYPVQSSIQGNNTLITLPIASPNDVNTHCNPTTKKCNYTINYNKGSKQISKTITRNQGSSYKLNTDSLINTCAFKLTFASGNLIISNNKEQIWSLNNSYKLTTPDSQVNLDWIKIYNEYFNKTPRIDLSILPVDTPFGPGQTIPYLLTSDGKYKLTIKNGQLVLLGCVIACQNNFNGISFTKTSDKNDNNVFYLYGVNKNIKMNKVMHANTETHTLTPLNYGDVLQLSNRYSSINATPQSDYYPPNVKDLNENKFKIFENKTQAQCEQECNNTAGCTYNYSYKTTDNIQKCIINTDYSVFHKYPKQDTTIASSSLNIRNKEIKSDHSYSTTEYADSNKNPLQINSTNNTTMLNYSDYSILPTNHSSLEGSLASPKILSSINKLQSVEGFTFLTGDSNKCTSVTGSNQLANCQGTLDNNIGSLKENSTAFVKQQTQISQNYSAYDAQYKLYNNLNQGVDEYDTIDNSGNLTKMYNQHNPSPNVNDVRIVDLNDTLLQQNLLFISGTLTLATIIVAAIIISRK